MLSKYDVGVLEIGIPCYGNTMGNDNKSPKETNDVD